MQIDTEIGAIEGVIRRLEDQKKTHDNAREAAAAYSEFVTESERKQREQIDKTAAADRARYEAAAQRYGVALPTAVVPITADTSAADRAVRSFLQTPRRLKIDIEGRLANGQRVI